MQLKYILNRKTKKTKNTGWHNQGWHNQILTHTHKSISPNSLVSNELKKERIAPQGEKLKSFWTWTRLIYEKKMDPRVVLDILLNWNIYWKITPHVHYKMNQAQTFDTADTRSKDNWYFLSEEDFKDREKIVKWRNSCQHRLMEL